MASADNYVVGSGQPVYGGRSPPSGGTWAKPSNNRVALVGDSLTDANLGLNWSAFFWINGRRSGTLQLVLNAGVSGDTVQMMRTRINNQWNDASKGLAGLGTLGVVVFRGGTNNARNGTTASAMTTIYADIFTQIAAYADLVIILACPPMGPTEGSYATKNALTLQYNQVLSDYAATSPAKFKYVDDGAALRNPDGTQVTGSFGPDGVHNIGKTTVQEGLTADAVIGPQLDSWAFPSPLTRSSADVYPGKPQWFPNPMMLGTSGTMGTGFTGQVVDGLSIAGNGAGSTAICSIVADATGNWQRVKPTQVAKTGAGEAIQIYSSLAGRTITASDPVSMEIAIEIRMNALDTTWFNSFRLWVQGSADVLTYDCELKVGGGVISDTIVLRSKAPKPNANASSFAHLFFNVSIANNFAGEMGSFDFRQILIRG